MSKQFEELKGMFTEHMKSSTKFREYAIKQLTKIDTDSGYTKDKLKTHDKNITELVNINNQRKGVIWVIGVIATSGFMGFIYQLLK